MMPAFHIKKNIDFNKNFSSLLEVLKFIAVQDYHATEKQLRTFARMQVAVADFLSAFDLNVVRHPFLQGSDKPTAVLAVTSDGGLLGGLNNMVMSKAIELVHSQKGRLVIVGDRGNLYAQEAGISATSFPGINDAHRFEQSCELRDYFMKNFVRGEFGGLQIVFPRAITFVLHRVEVATLVPYPLEVAEGSAPAETRTPMTEENTIFESSPSELVEYLVFLAIGQKVYEILGMSRLTEHAARFTHLEESCQKIGEVNIKLLRQYFRRRHELIDANMRELFSARNLFANK